MRRPPSRSNRRWAHVHAPNGKNRSRLSGKPRPLSRIEAQARGAESPAAATGQLALTQPAVAQRASAGVATQQLHLAIHGQRTGGRGCGFTYISRMRRSSSHSSQATATGAATHLLQPHGQPAARSGTSHESPFFQRAHPFAGSHAATRPGQAAMAGAAASQRTAAASAIPIVLVASAASATSAASAASAAIRPTRRQRIGVDAQPSRSG